MTPPSRAAIIANLKAFLPYSVAAVIFITVSVVDPRFMLNWSPGLALLLAVVWVIPALWRRWRR